MKDFKMTILKNYNEFSEVEALEVKDVLFVTGKETQKTVNAEDLLGCIVSKVSDPNKNSEPDTREFINNIMSSINDVAGASAKGSKFIEPYEIEKIKKNLTHFEARSEKLTAIKNELEKFGSQIKMNYVNKIDEAMKGRAGCLEQIEMLTNARQEVIKKRLLQLTWPYDEKTKTYERKIAALKIRVAKYNYMIKQLSGMRPAANEKDILMFQVKLKSKFMS